MSDVIDEAHNISLYAGQEFQEGIIGAGKVVTAKVNSGPKWCVS